MPVATAQTADSNLNKLGQIYEVDGMLYVMVKAAAAIAAAAGRGLSIGFTSGAPNWTVNFPAAATTEFLVAVPAGQSGSASSVDLASGDYFLGQIWGAHSALLAANTTLVYSLGQVLQANTTGLWAAWTVAPAAGTTAGGGTKATNTAAVASASAAFTGWIQTII
jgi:hypothetical protein